MPKEERQKVTKERWKWLMQQCERHNFISALITDIEECRNKNDVEYLRITFIPAGITKDKTPITLPMSIASDKGADKKPYNLYAILFYICGYSLLDLERLRELKFRPLLGHTILLKIRYQFINGDNGRAFKMVYIYQLSALKKDMPNFDINLAMSFMQHQNAFESVRSRPEKKKEKTPAVIDDYCG